MGSKVLLSNNLYVFVYVFFLARKMSATFYYCFCFFVSIIHTYIYMYLDNFNMIPCQACHISWFVSTVNYGKVNDTYIHMNIWNIYVYVGVLLK